MAQNADAEQPLDDVLVQLLRAIDEGQSIKEGEWLAKHPDLSAELQGFLRRYQKMERLVEPLRHAPEGVLNVRCPHCRQPMQLLDDVPLAAIHCNSCGSRFSLIGEDAPAARTDLTKVGHFELLEHVGCGQFGSVWRARDTQLDRTVAVKIPRRGQLDGVDAELFLRDARAAAQLQHPNIVSVHEVGRSGDAIYIVSDFIGGVTLKEWIAERRVTCNEAAILCAKIAKALHHAHRAGVIHRDLKPGNVMVDADREPHIVDFGLAKRESGEITMTVAGQVLGTPAYMPPEQARGEGHVVDCRADIYSLGVILYEMATGELPFRGDRDMLIVQILNDDPPPPRKLNRIVPRDLETITLKCLAKEPAKRYGDSLQVAHDLERHLAGRPILARPISRGERCARWCRRNPVVAGLSAATLLLLATVAAGYLREADLRQNVESSLFDLTHEQQRNSRLQQDVTGLETAVANLEDRRRHLDASLANGRRQLALGEERLHETYMKLARAAWRDDEVELADFYLEQCPAAQRQSAWRELKRQCHPPMETFEGQHCVAVSADGKTLAAGGANHHVKLWDIATGQLVLVLKESATAVAAVDFSSDGRLLAAGSGTDVLLWDLSDGTLARTLQGHQAPVTDVDFSAGGRLASASFQNDSGELIVWNLDTFQPRPLLPGVKHAVFNHDGSLLASARASGATRPHQFDVVVWRLDSLAAESDPQPTAIIRANHSCRPAFHPLKNELAVSQGDNAVEFWDIDAQRILRRFSGEVRVGCLAYNADGNRLAYTGTTSQSSLRPDTFRTVVWNLITGEKERILPWYSSAVVGAAFSADGQRLITADGSTIKMWDVTPPPDPTQLILDDIVQLDVGRYDWPQWGGSRARINTPAGRNIPASWNVGHDKPWIERGTESDSHLTSWRPDGSTNIKWAVRLGSQTYGNPVVANGKIFLGTNNGSAYLKRYRHTDLGVLLCVEEQTGRFLWQHSNEKLASGRAHDWPEQGVCSTPMIDGDRLWYVSNRGEVVCLDTEGFLDGEDDGPVTREMVRMFQVSINTLLRQHLQTTFAQAAIELPEHWTLRELDARTHWAIVHSTYQTGTTWLYDVRADRSQLLIAQCDQSPEHQPSKERFTVAWPLLDLLDNSGIVQHCSQYYADAGVPWLDRREIEIQTAQEAREWTFHMEVRGIDRSFRIEVIGDSISGFMTLADEPEEADVVWKFDMMREVGVSQHNMATCSIITADGLLFVCTSNGLDESHLEIPAPDAPSFMALDRETGRVVWTDNSPGTNILHAQWASPSYGVFDGRPQVIFPGGDGWVYSFDPKGDGRGGSKLLWKFDANPKTSIWTLGGRGTRNNIIAFPAIYDGLVYIVMGQDPEHGEGSGHLWCIDPRKRVDGSDVSAELAVDPQGIVLPPRRIRAVDVAKGEMALPNPDSAVVWHYSYQDQNNDGQISFEETFHRSLSIPVIKDDILYVSDFSGLLHCLHAKTGKVYWTYDQMAACWGSALLVDGKVYVCDEDGDVSVFRHWADPGVAFQAVAGQNGGTQILPVKDRWEGDLLAEINMGASIYMTPIVANNVLYIATRNTLYAMEAEVEAPPP